MREKILTQITTTFTNLFKVKTLITLAITFIFCYLAYKEKLPVETTTMVIGMVFTYYFNKKDGNGNGL